MAHSHYSVPVRLRSETQDTCWLVQDLLPRYLEGEVSPATRDRIGAHLARCERCAGFLAGMQRTRARQQLEQRQRQSIIVADAPARQILQSSQHLLWLIVLVIGVLVVVALFFLLIVGLRLLLNAGLFLFALTVVMLLIGGIVAPRS